MVLQATDLAGYLDHRSVLELSMISSVGFSLACSHVNQRCIQKIDNQFPAHASHTLYKCTSWKWYVIRFSFQQKSKLFISSFVEYHSKEIEQPSLTRAEMSFIPTKWYVLIRSEVFTGKFALDP